jgi:peptidoglycan-N-acetylglucosamine deacetylase
MAEGPTPTAQRPSGTIRVTTSWDDGHRLDLRMADLLAGVGATGTFYVSPRSVEWGAADRLSEGHLRFLAAAGFEIGSHTLTHPRLDRLPVEAARREIDDGKAALEDALSAPVTSFCYPYGAYGPEHPALVREAGFTLARTIRRYWLAPPDDPFQLPTSSHASRYRADLYHLLRHSRTPRQWLTRWRHWDVLARHLVGRARGHGGVFHLWGHSWEIDGHDDWQRLGAFLRFLAEQEDVVFVTNAQLLERAAGAA